MIFADGELSLHRIHAALDQCIAHELDRLDQREEDLIKEALLCGERYVDIHYEDDSFKRVFL